MRFLLAAALALCTMAAPALADQVDCKADLAALRTALGEGIDLHGNSPLAALEPATVDGACVVRDLVIAAPVGAALGTVLAGQITWRAGWADATRSGLPHDLVLDIADGRIMPQYGDRGNIDYQMRLGAELNSTALHLDYAIDPAAKRLILNSFDVSQTRGNRMALRGTIIDFDPAALFAAPPQIDKIMQFRLTDLDLRLRNAGLFESMAMLWLDMIQPQFGDTPEAAVTGLQSWLMAEIAAIPDDYVPQDSRAAMAAMVGTLPHPNGVMHLRISTDRGISAQDLLPAFMLGQPSWATLKQPLAGMRLTADWQPPQPCACDADW